MGGKDGGKSVFSDGDNIKYILKNWWAFDKRSVCLYIFMLPPLVIMPILTALIPKLIIDSLDIGRSAGEIVLLIALMSLLIALITWINPFLGEKASAVAENMNTHYRIKAFRRMMKADYEYIESLDGRLAFDKSKRFTESWGSGLKGFFGTLVKFASNVVGLFTYTVILTAVDPALVGIVLACGAVDAAVVYFYIRKSNAWADELSAYNLKTSYIFNTANDYNAGKDVRVYGFGDFFSKLSANVMRGIKKLAGELFNIELWLFGVPAGALTLICESAAFFYLLSGVLADRISVSDFIFYFALVTGFFTWIFELITTLFGFKKIAFNCGRYREFAEAENAKRGGLPVPKTEDFPCEIEFRNVTFAYKGSDEPVIKDMSFKIGRGEKIAVVGENGAGKTTGVKLLCGFYKPQKGSILLNGCDISEFGEKEYFGLFAAVFQDFIILPLSIEKNIALVENDADIDAERLETALRRSGLYEKVQSLPQKGKTRLIKKVFDDAVDFSGGETQKLLLARALYKDAEILILDEPTAALDPVAENEMYLKYRSFADNKTSVFISHRLSSTRFCDRIFFVKNGKIIESGTHEELLAQKGDYWRMYEIQAYYYRKNAEEQAV
ncbi:MAG: ABC transporter ATP-binding protein/permease [Clostridiales bacterium]|jgi:ABC-type multidrug transport system fused ATPase/permease subunit|nr:ABC transporter ATP-binding protein/permease [Clostridiales bacterium]